MLLKSDNIPFFVVFTAAISVIAFFKSYRNDQIKIRKTKIKLDSKRTNIVTPGDGKILSSSIVIRDNKTFQMLKVERHLLAGKTNQHSHKVKETKY